MTTTTTGNVAMGVARGGSRMGVTAVGVRALGVMIVAAASTKLHAGLTDPFNEWAPSDRLQVLTEATIGVWVLTTHRLRIAHLVLIALFAMFAAVAIHGLATGADSCGCFGRYSPPPLFVLLFDLAALTGLITLRPAIGRSPPVIADRNTPPSGIEQPLWNSRGRVSGPLLLTVLLMAAPALLLIGAGGSSGSDHHSLPPPESAATGLPESIEVGFGYVEPGSTIVRTFDLPIPHLNLAVSGLDSECDCLRAVEPPAALRPDRSSPLRLELEAPDKHSLYTKRIRLSFDGATPPHLDVVVRARIGLPLEVVPEALTIDPGSNPLPTITVANHGPEPVRLLYATSDAPTLYVHVPRGDEALLGGRDTQTGEGDNRSAIDLTVRLKEGASWTDLTGREVAITLHTTCAAQPAIRCRLRFRESEAAQAFKP